MLTILSLLSLLLSPLVLAKDLPGCQVYAQNQCDGNTITTNASFARNRWFTPPQGAAGAPASFAGYDKVVAYAQVVYSDATRSSATVTVKATTRDPGATLAYAFGAGAAAQSSASKTFDADSQTQPLVITVTTEGGISITLEPIDFIWNVPALPSPPAGSDYRGGQKGAIVEMFGWPDKDIEQECAFLAKAGYLGVKLYPHQEQLMSGEPFQNLLNPWYFMYQPVSYRLQGRMGSRDDLRRLITTCRGLGVRVYADAVINHFTGGGNDMAQHRRQDGGTCTTWPNKSSSLASTWGGLGDGPSPFYTQSNVFETSPVTGLPPLNEFPAAAIGPLDFHCERVLNSWNDPLDLNAGWLTGLTDLNTERDHVQERIASYLTDLISIGMSGFRIDAAKHIKPDDLAAILKKFKRNMGGALPKDFITWLEVLLGGESDLLMCDGDSGYNYGAYLETVLGDPDPTSGLPGLSPEEVLGVKIWNSGYPKETEKGLVGCDGSNASLTIRSVIQNDDADQQNPGSSSRDMGDTGCVLIKGCSVDEHRAFEVKLFTSPNGAQSNKDDFPIRVVLSSFYWPNASGGGGGSGLQGVPDGKSDCALCTSNCEGCQSVAKVQAYDESSSGYDKEYTRVHRDASIVQAMRTWVGLQD